MSIAHKIGEKTRTGDVLISEKIDFSSLLLSENVIRGLQNCGFERPSPIQLKAIPLGRCGLDVIVQAKSGTGKTCVFSVIALESIQLQSSAAQVLVLAPTREIAIQIWEVIKGIGDAMPGLQCHTFIGGMPVSEDKQKLRKCHIAVGSPGRIKQLIETGLLKTDSVRLFVLDEADKLLEESFQEQINWIYSALPDNKQMLALSATYPEYLAQHLTRYMRNPTFMRLNITDPALLGIRQYYKSVPYSPMANLAFENKTKAVVEILSGVSFQQCLVFSNLQTRAQNLSEELLSLGWPTACIAGSHDQKDRIEAMARLKTYKCRVLISTDLTSRGIDADKVNLVINLDVPQNHETYLHRIGRAGRFGSFGAAVTIASNGQEEIELRAVEKKCNTNIKELPDPLPADLLKTVAPVNLDDVVITEQLITRPDGSPDLQPANQINEQKDILHNHSHNDFDSVKEHVKESPDGCKKRLGEIVLTGHDGQVSAEVNGLESQSDVQKTDKHCYLMSGNIKETNAESKIFKSKLENSMNSVPESNSNNRTNLSASETRGPEKGFVTMSNDKRESNGQEKLGCSTLTSQRQIAKARRKRKADDKNVNVISSSTMSGQEASPSPEVHSSNPSDTIHALLASSARNVQQTLPKITLLCLTERLGCTTIHIPHSYTSALVDYEKFLEEGESVDSVQDVGDLIIRKIDVERKILSSDKESVVNINDCINKIYTCVLTAGNQMTTAGVAVDRDNPPEKLSFQVPEPCIQKCSKSTQTSTHNNTYSRSKTVRYHPMSVSSLALASSNPNVHQNDENITIETVRCNGGSDNLHNDAGIEQKKKLCFENRSDSVPTEHRATSRSSGSCVNNVGTKELSREQSFSKTQLEMDSKSETAREDCELIYVSEQVGKISLTSQFVTVESGLLDSVDCRPKSRKGKITADLDGHEFGRICGQENTKENFKFYDMQDQNEEPTSSSDSSATSDSSSSSDYEEEVFCNNYVDEPVQSDTKTVHTGRAMTRTYKEKKSRLSRKCNRNYDNPYNHLGYQTFNQLYSDQYSSGADTINHDPWNSIPHGYYSPYNYFHPYQYTYPYWNQWYPQHYFPQQHHPGAYYQPSHYSGGWASGLEKAAWCTKNGVDTMQRNMEFQKKYIRKMAKIN